MGRFPQPIENFNDCHQKGLGH
ncbi:MAG: hypothetical protein RLZZ22_1557, partial [Pseudomonadota bacterium]